MSDVGATVEQPAEETQPAVRLRSPERRPMTMVVQCPDDLVGPTQPVRRVLAVTAGTNVS